MNRWTSRKLFVAIGVFATGTALLVMGLIDADIWKWVAGGSVVSYLGSQGLTDALAALKK